MRTAASPPRHLGALARSARGSGSGRGILDAALVRQLARVRGPPEPLAPVPVKNLIGPTFLILVRAWRRPLKAIGIATQERSAEVRASMVHQHPCKDGWPNELTAAGHWTAIRPRAGRGGG